MKLGQKLTVVALVLAGFMIYLNVDHKAEPTWKVNESHFTVAKSVEKGLQGEFSTFPDLKLLDYFGLLKETDKKIMLPEEQRTIKIEKVWCTYYKTYVLYSVDLKKDDQSLFDVPYLDVNNVEYSGKNGQNVQAAVEDKGISSFVYKHRLYRSVHIVPKLANRNEWNQMKDMNKISFVNLKAVTKQQSSRLEPLTLKMDRTAVERYYGKKSVKKSFSLPSNNKVTIKDYELNVLGSRFNLDMQQEKNLVGFYGITNYERQQWELLGSREKGYFLYFDRGEDPLSQKKLDFKLLGAVYRSDQTIAWNISKSELIKLYQRVPMPKKKVQKGEVHETSISYLGLGRMGNQPYIGFSLNPKEVKEFLTWPQTTEDTSNDKERLNNLVSLKTSNGQELDISIDFSEGGQPNEFAIMLPKGFKPQDVKVEIKYPAYYQKLENEVEVQVKTSDITRTKKNETK